MLQRGNFCWLYTDNRLSSAKTAMSFHWNASVILVPIHQWRERNKYSVEICVHERTIITHYVDVYIQRVQRADEVTYRDVTCITLSVRLFFLNAWYDLQHGQQSILRHVSPKITAQIILSASRCSYAEWCDQTPSLSLLPFRPPDGTTSCCICTSGQVATICYLAAAMAIATVEAPFTAFRVRTGK